MKRELWHRHQASAKIATATLAGLARLGRRSWRSGGWVALPPNMVGHRLGQRLDREGFWNAFRAALKRGKISPFRHFATPRSALVSTGSNRDRNTNRNTDRTLMRSHGLGRRRIIHLRHQTSQKPRSIASASASAKVHVRAHNGGNRSRERRQC